MNLNRKIQYEYGVSIIDGKIRHISEIDKRGRNCQCLCPECGCPLDAKLGKGLQNGGRTPHFSHGNDSRIICDAKKANETALHKLAKEIFQENKYIILPEYNLSGETDELCNKNDSRQ